MPALTFTTDVWEHIFRNTGNSSKKLSGFHSRALVKDSPSDALVPKIKRTFPSSGTHGFYLCGWNFYPKKQDPKKWSTMFPDSWSEKKVRDAVTQARDYWNANFKAGESDGASQSNSSRLAGLKKKYGVAWVGQATVDGYTYIIGGMVKNSQIASAFPLMGANSNFPKIQFDGQVNVDIEDNDETGDA